MGSGIFPDIRDSFNQICGFFCEIYSYIFELSNYILFVWFLFLFYKLYVGVRDKEEDERLYSYKLAKLKKHGRIGMAICIIIGLLFLTKTLNIVIEEISRNFISPPLSGLIFFKAPESYDDSAISYNELINRSEISLGFIEGFILYTYSIIPFICFILFTYGVYLSIYNNKILHTKWKPAHLLLIGIVGMMLFGLGLPFHLMGMEIHLPNLGGGTGSY